jgi:hypothetical protein
VVRQKAHDQEVNNNNNIIYFNLTSQYITIVFKSVVRKKGDESFQINAVLGLGVGLNPGSLAPESFDTRYCIVNNLQAITLKEKFKIKVAKCGTPKNY